LYATSSPASAVLTLEGIPCSAGIHHVFVHSQLACTLEMKEDLITVRGPDRETVEETEAEGSLAALSPARPFMALPSSA
jgi:hypothetical protein